MEPWQLKPAQDLGMSIDQRLRSVRRERGTIPWLTHLVCWAAVRGMMKIYHRLSIEGQENLPREGSFVLVSNHCSHLDMLALACALPWRLRPDAFPIAAGDTFFKTRMMAVLSALFVNALPMWRRGAVNHSLADLRERLTAQHCVYIIFPEGTRSRDGRMDRFKSGLGMIIAATAVPVVPCRLWGTFAALRPGRHLPRPVGLRVKIGTALKFETTSNDRDGWDQIARTLETAVAQLQ
jgi:1-acyl-sn-glycerol-3-phosphate acyltransferase